MIKDTELSIHLYNTIRTDMEEESMSMNMIEMDRQTNQRRRRKKECMNKGRLNRT